MMNDLKGKVAIVTGGNRDMGAVICNYLAKLGMKVVIDYPTASDSEDANKLNKVICEKGGDAIAIQADVTKDEEVSNLVIKAMDKFSRFNFNIGVVTI